MTSTWTPLRKLSSDVDFEELVSVILSAQQDDTAARLTIGEAACVLRDRYGHGGLSEAARTCGIKYKTLHEYASVVHFYNGDEPVALYESRARELVEELPVLSWTRLREARSVFRDPKEAEELLIWYASNMPPLKEWYAKMRSVKKNNGHEQREWRIDNGKGLVVIIRRENNASAEGGK